MPIFVGDLFGTSGHYPQANVGLAKQGRGVHYDLEGPAVENASGRLGTEQR